MLYYTIVHALTFSTIIMKQSIGIQVTCMPKRCNVKIQVNTRVKSIGMFTYRSCTCLIPV